jgi:hypothetical protein
VGSLRPLRSTPIEVTSSRFFLGIISLSCRFFQVGESTFHAALVAQLPHETPENQKKLLPLNQINGFRKALLISPTNPRK